MSARTALDERMLEQLADFAAQWTGFSRDAILPDAIRRATLALLAQHHTPEELLLRASRRDPSVVHALCQAVSVGETFFFRHPEHFRWVAGTFLPELLARGATRLRAWSAGCATGEEPYSIAACLIDALPWPPTVALEVLGTDLLERNIVAARNGLYGNWSRRPSGPLLHPLYHQQGADQVRIDDRVRAVTSFKIHNLLEPSPNGPFDLIFCRNVLVYFSQDAIRAAVSHLARALAPGGALLFGSMDVSEPPPGLVSAGFPELQIYRRFERASTAIKTPVKLAPLPESAFVPRTQRKSPPEPVALHLRALVHIERGEKKVAEKALQELVAQVPDYVPGILERALLHVRMGERSAAASLMREVLKRTDKLPPEDVLPGPEPLPVSFYRDSAQTFLRGAHGGLE